VFPISRSRSHQPWWLGYCEVATRMSLPLPEEFWLEAWWQRASVDRCAPATWNSTPISFSKSFEHIGQHHLDTPTREMRFYVIQSGMYTQRSNIRRLTMNSSWSMSSTAPGPRAMHIRLARHASQSFRWFPLSSEFSQVIFFDCQLVD
jgi:hypothetical protein